MFISGIQIPDPKACPADKQTATQDREQSQFSQRRAERNPGWNGLTSLSRHRGLKVTPWTGRQFGSRRGSVPSSTWSPSCSKNFI